MSDEATLLLEEAAALLDEIEAVLDEEAEDRAIRLQLVEIVAREFEVWSDPAQVITAAEKLFAYVKEGT
jgi:hypothetical protein